MGWTYTKMLINNNIQPVSTGVNNNLNLRPPGYAYIYTLDELKEIQRCKVDPIYFIENYVKIIDVSGNIVLPTLRDYQKKAIKTYLLNKISIVMQPRQTAKTTTVAMLLVWYIVFNPNKLSAILGNKEKIAIEILSKIQFSYEQLPWFIQQGVKIFNRKEIQLENNSRVIASATSASGLRGFTITGILFLDEFAFVDDNKAEPFWTSVYPTISQPGNKAKLIVSSTPRGYNFFYSLWSAAEKKSLPITPFRVYWWDVPDRDDAWAATERQILGPKKYAAEVECSFLGSSNTLIDAKHIAAISSEAAAHVSNDGLSVFKEPEDGHTYFISCDPSRGIGGDKSAFVVIDITTFPYEVVATYKNNSISPRVLPLLLEKIGKTYKEAYILVEINDNGQEVANILDQDLEYDNVIRPGGFHELLCGLRTTKKTKSIGCSAFKDLVENKKLILKDNDLKVEVQNFIEKGGSYKADVGYTDDIVMACVNFSYISTLQMFQNLTDMNFKQEMIRLHEQAIEDDVAPFGFIVTGHESEEEWSTFY